MSVRLQLCLLTHERQMEVLGDVFLSDQVSPIHPPLPVCRSVCSSDKDCSHPAINATCSTSVVSATWSPAGAFLPPAKIAQPGPAPAPIARSGSTPT